MPLITSRPKIKTTVDGLPLAYQLFTEGNYVPIVVEIERTTITDDLTNAVVVFSASGGNDEYYVSKSSDYPSEISLISITNDSIKALVKLVQTDTLFYLDNVTNFQYSVGLKTDLGLMELERGYFNVNPSLALGKRSQAPMPDAPPIIELLAPTPNDILLVNKPFKLLAKASDIGGAVEKVSFYANDIKIGTNTSYSRKGIWDFKYVPSQAGSVTFYAIATDSSGNATKSAAVAASVQPEPVVPTANFSFTPLTGSAPLAVTFVNTSVNASSYSWNFGDNSAVETTIAPVHIYQFSGNYTVTLTATNQYGSVSISKSITVSVATNQPPIISVTNPANNSSVIVGQQLSLTATATDDGSISSVQFKVNGANQNAALSSSPYTTSWTPSAAGTYTITAVATDNAGLTTTSAAVNLTVTVPVNQPPTVSVTSPTNNSAVTTGQAVTLTATASDSNGTISTVQFQVNGVSQGVALTTSPYTTSWIPSTTGSYSIRAIATDNLGLSTTSSIVTVTVNVPINQAPTVSVTSPTNNSTVTTGQAVTLTATANDADGTISTVQFQVNGVSQGVALTTSPYTTSWTPSTAGSYSIRAIVTDNLGLSTTSSIITVTVNTPAIPTPTVTTTVAPRAGLFNTATSLGASASVTGDTISSVQFRVNGTNQGAAIVASPYTLSYTPTAKGVYAVTAIASGSQGGSATSSVVNYQAFDTKIVGGGSGAGTSLGAIAADYILFDNNQSAGGVAATMVINVGGIQVAAFNYTDTAYLGKPFAYFDSANSMLRTETVKPTVNF